MPKFVMIILLSLLAKHTSLAQGNPAKLDLPVLGSAAAKKGGHFRFALPVNPATLNPLKAHDNYSIDVLPWMIESLLSRHEDTYAWVPILAESYEISSDKQTFTFQIRKNVQFHDGSPMTAHDVEFSFKVYSTDLYGTPIEKDILKHIDKIEVLETHKIRFHTANAQFDNLAVIGSVPIVPKSIYGNRSEIPKLNKSVVGTGPYRFKDYKVGQSLSLEANPKWWGKPLPYFKNKYNFEKITVRFIGEPHAVLLALEKGDIDFGGLRYESFAKFTQGPAWNKSVFLEKDTSASVFTTQQSIFLNLRRPLFKSLEVRRALQLALNRDWINATMLGNSNLLATGPWHRLNEYADPGLEPVKFDTKEAAKLLKKDGWIDSDKDGVLDRMIDGKKTDFRFSILLPNRDFEKYLVAYQTDLRQIGVQIELAATDWTLFMKRLDDLDFDSYVVGRGYPGVVDFNPKTEWHSKYISKNSDNAIGYANPQVDELLEKAEVEHDRLKRIELLRKAYRLISADQSQVFWFSRPEDYYARSARLKTEKPSYKYARGLNYWWIEE